MPPELVDTCLNYGIAGSILLRGVFIFAGLAATSAFSPLLLGFSVFLLFSSYQLLVGGDDEEDDDELPTIVVDLLAKLPLTGTFEGKSFAMTDTDGALLLTQLTATLTAIALCDVIFAVDSIPAVLAVRSNIHTRAHVPVHARTHTHITHTHHTYTYTHTNTRARPHTPTNTPTHIHVRTHTHRPANTRYT